jgi:hypothetical protein
MCQSHKSNKKPESFRFDVFEFKSLVTHSCLRNSNGQEQNEASRISDKVEKQLLEDIELIGFPAQRCLAERKFLTQRELFSSQRENDAEVRKEKLLSSASSFQLTLQPWIEQVIMENI